MSGRYFTDADGVVVTLDFTDEEVVRSAIHVHRQTKTSRRPGMKVEGSHVRDAEARHFVLCECGSYRWNDDVPHAVRVNRDATGKVDCMGRAVPP